MKRLFLIPLLFVNLLCFPLFGQQKEYNNPPPAEEVPPSFLEELQKVDEAGESRFFQEFLNMLFVLGLLVGFMLLAAWFLKRMMKTRLEQQDQLSNIKISESRTITQKTTVYILKIRDKEIAVAESHNGITKLAEFPFESPEKRSEFERLLQD